MTHDVTNPGTTSGYAPKNTHPRSRTKENTMSRIRMTLGATVAVLTTVLALGLAAPADAAPVRPDVRPIGCC
jgi:hypothetical protein